MDRFSKLNPAVSFLFFVFIIVLTLIFFNPIMLGVSFVGALLYNIKLDGKKALGFAVKFILPLVIFVALFNMLFSHYGQTVLFTVKDYDFTFESAFYGFNQGLLLGGVIMWFNAYSRVITSDRFLALFSRIAPNSAIVFSMVISFIPRLRNNAQQISDARQLINGEGKLKKSLNNFSALISLTLEESIEVSDSMRARGFNKNRRPYSRYTLKAFDVLLIILLSSLFIALVLFKSFGLVQFIFEPYVKLLSFTPSAFILYLIISFLPLILDLMEDLKWLYLKQKI